MEGAQSNQSLKRPPSAFMGTSYDVSIIPTNKDYQALKDEGFDGSFEEFKDRFYKLNGIINYAIDESSEMWDEYDARNNSMSDDELYREESQTSKLYSQTLTTREDGYKIADDNETVDVVYLPQNVVPDFRTKRELVTFIKTLLGNERNITIKSTGENVFISNRGVERGASKSRSAEYNEAFGAVRQLLENAKYSGFVERDEKHPNVRGQDVYHSGLVIGDKPYSVMFKIDIPEGESSHNYAGHKISDIQIAPTTDNGGQVTIPTKTEVDAIRNITLAVLRGKVNPARKECVRTIKTEHL